MTAAPSRASISPAMRPHPAALPLLLLTACGGPALVELSPSSGQRFGRAQTATVHATPREKSGKPAPSALCRWSSSDEQVVKVAAGAKCNDVAVTSVGPGAATVTCAIGDLKASLQASVRVVGRIEAPAEAALTLSDDRAALPLAVKAFDDQGAPITGRLAFTRCADEEVCRGDARGQLWATGPGKTTATVEVEGVKATVAVTVTDARTDATRPQVVKKGFMEDLEREVARKQAAEAKAAAAAEAKAAGASRK